MEDFKVFKDPIYGYIEIDSNIANHIIDSNVFQRLRNIRQTSYSPVYHASMHTRFSHSIGVYYLGSLAIKKIGDSLKRNNSPFETKEEWLSLAKIFLLACLLHDVGHAPYSHTGEKFYLLSSVGIISEIEHKLADIIEEDSFRQDIIIKNRREEKANAHEIMSALVALENFSEFFPMNEDKEFFARCILGYKYNDKNSSYNKKKEIKNCIIDLLNSTLIDLDKIDYLIRDSFFTGYENISIDYRRLINAFMLEENEEGKVFLAFHKSALSIIENVVFAHDSERKWIQNHPIILYEHYLVQHYIMQLEKFYSIGSSGKLFSSASLSKTGNEFTIKDRNGNGQEHKCFISLLADDTIVYNMKNIYSTTISDEYLDRRTRKHPVWKSEAEYAAIFESDLGEKALDKLEEAFTSICKFLEEKLDIYVINEEAIKSCKESIKQIESIPEKERPSHLKKAKHVLQWLEFLSEHSLSHQIEFDYVIVQANKFRSNFNREELKKIQISFPNLGICREFGNVSTVLSSNEPRKEFFYLFYNRKSKKINIVDFAKGLMHKAIDENK